MPLVFSRMLLLVLFSVLCASLGFFRANAQTVTAMTLAGERISGELANWSTEGVTLDADGKSQTVAAVDLLNLQFASQPGSLANKAMVLNLIDGTQLEIASFEMHEHTATVKSHWVSGPLQVPTAVIQFLRLPTELELEWVSQWKKTDSSADVLVVNKKGSDKCDFLAGVIQEVTPTHVQFTWEGDTLPVKRSKLAGLSFYHAQSSDDSEPLCRLQLTSGESLAVRTLKMTPAGLSVTTVSGLTLETPLSELARADYSVGKLEYLSDCEPLIQKWTPLIGLPGDGAMIQDFGAPRRDVSWESTPLTLSWPATAEKGEHLKTYAKGLAIRSRTELEYRVPKSMNKFLATAGIDPETASQGNAVLRIELDGTVAFEQSINGHQGPVSIDLEIADRHRMKVTVDYGENLDLGDHLHLAEARWSK